MKPFLARHDNRVKPAADIKTAMNNRKGRRPERQGIVMIKALSALAIAAFIAAALTVLPSFAPEVEAGVSSAPLAKSDRLDIRANGPDCSRQTWPNFDAACLRRAGSPVGLSTARVIRS